MVQYITHRVRDAVKYFEHEVQREDSWCMTLDVWQKPVHALKVEPIVRPVLGKNIGGDVVPLPAERIEIFAGLGDVRVAWDTGMAFELGREVRI
jgi:hypothetical protein